MMANWDFEDRDNDWLAEEMRREGYNYRAKTSGGVLKAAHADEEHMFRADWKTGAVANKAQHERNHARIHSQTGRQQTSQKGIVDAIVTIVFFIIFVLFFIISFNNFF